MPKISYFHSEDEDYVVINGRSTSYVPVNKIIKRKKQFDK